jgi:hypothetical protein
VNLRALLLGLARAVADEAERNEEFRKKLVELILSPEKFDSRREVARGRGGRRTSAVFDPIELARRDEPALRARLNELNIEQLRDIVAQFGMDPGKLVMKWKDVARIIDRIAEVSIARATKGDAFRS